MEKKGGGGGGVQTLDFPLSFIFFAMHGYEKGGPDPLDPQGFVYRFLW